MSNRRTVLFVCMGNSCRSAMAEGLVNHFMGDEWQAVSAGIRPAVRVNPIAVQVMLELGIDISTHQPQPVAAFYKDQFDALVILCDQVADIRTQLQWPSAKIQQVIGFEDPALFAGPPEEKREVYQRIRNEIRAEVLPFLRSTLTR
jgi:arsenate reductase